MDNDRKYPLGANVEMFAGGATKDEALARNMTPADAVVVVPVVYDSTGTIQRTMTYSGRTDGGDMPDLELWHTWSLMAFDLSSREGLPKVLRDASSRISELGERLIAKLKEERAKMATAKAEAPGGV